MTEPFFKSVLKLSARPLIGFILFLMCCEASAETPYFTNHLAMLKYQMGLKFTNSFEEGFEANVLNLLPANFLTNLLAELNGSNFNALVARVHGLSNQWIPGFRSYLCVEPRYVSVSVLCYASAEQCKRLEEVIRFYVNGRFAGHSQAYLYDAIKECGTYEESEPVLGLPTGLKRRYWIPSKWVERGPDEGVWLVRDGPSFVWQCRHVAASWFYEKEMQKSMIHSYRANSE